MLILGEVVGVHIDEALHPRRPLRHRARAKPLARCGYQDYAVVESVFSLARPKGGGDV